MNRGIPAKRILVVDDEPMIVSLLSTILREKGWNVTEAASGTEGIDRLEQSPFDVILTDLVMPGDSGIDLLRAAKEVLPDTEVILMTGFATADTAIEAMRNGAFHYIMKPLKTEEVAHLVEKAYEQRMLARENRFLKSEIGAAYHVQSLVGDSEPVLRLVEALQGFAAVDDPVLLAGERGTGRGFFARFIHFNSRRAAELCVPVRCPGTPRETLVADLFGRPGVAGDRTSPPRQGKMELANHGTLYLADIEEADREVLQRLERFLLTKTILPVGETGEIPLDIRIVASSSVPVRELALRENIPPGLLKAFEPGTVRIPPLREHPGDVPLLLHHFLREANRERKKPLRGFTSSALSALEAHDWPGNVRELRDLVGAIAAKKKQGTMIDATDIPPAILYRRPRRTSPGTDP
ncbi:MAG: sigma-54 dependent transcriptional regulator [Deltaproteobacteria bacterium]